MPNKLQKAEAQYQAGEHRRAVDTLWEVTFIGDHAEVDARGVIALATQLKDVTHGGVEHDCDEHIARAERFLELAGDPVARARREELDRRRREEPVQLAREARAAGLTWLEIRRGEDVVAAEMLAALATDASVGSTPQLSMIDAVEAEGWRLEHLACFGWIESARHRCCDAPRSSCAACSSTASQTTPSLACSCASSPPSRRRPAAEYVTAMFRPTRVQTSVLRGAEFFMGGEVVDGEEIYLYLFRRVDEASG